VAAEVCSRAAGMCDVIVGNDMEFGVLAGDAAEGLAAARALVGGGAGIVVYKMGEKGAITITAGEEFSTGIFPVVALKPTGAGDSFLGALVAALAEGRPLREAVLRGAAAAAIVVGRVACAPAMPDRVELDLFLARNPAPGAI